MICEYNLQIDLCCLDHRAVERSGPKGPRGFGAGKYRYLLVRSNIPVKALEEYKVYTMMICEHNLQTGLCCLNPIELWKGLAPKVPGASALVNIDI